MANKKIYIYKEYSYSYDKSIDYLISTNNALSPPIMSKIFKKRIFMFLKKPKIINN